MADEKPNIRLLHHMARSGGTVISKCLASMRGVALLSEVNPAGLAMFDPIKQAQNWYGVFTDAEIEELAGAGKLGYLDMMETIAARLAARGLDLVVRDWSHLDFTAVPFLEKPSYELRHRAVLARQFAVHATASVRHPLDQWLSLSRLQVMRGKITPDAFLVGHRRFAEHCAAMGFVRYEDFARDPDTALRQLCGHLALRFDPGYRDRWAAYANITGDVRLGSTKTEISPTQRGPVEPALLAAFAASADYRRSLELLGYEHPA